MRVAQSGLVAWSLHDVTVFCFCVVFLLQYLHMLPVFSFSVQAFYYTLSKLGTSGHAGCVDVGGVGAMVKFLLRDLSLSASALLLLAVEKKLFKMPCG